AIYRTMLDLNPSNFEFLNNMAWTLSEEMNKPDEALRWADEAVKKAGPKPAILDTRGVVLTRLKQFDRAARDLDEPAPHTPAGPLFYHLARPYKRAGRLDDRRKARDGAVKAGLSREHLQPAELADWDGVMGK